MPGHRPSHALVALAAAMTLLAACQSGGPTSSASAGPLTSPSAAATAAGSGATSSTSDLARCHTGGLALAPIGAPGVGAGNVYAELGLTNRTGAACYLYGYVGMALLDAGGNQLPTRVVRDTGSRFPWAHVGLLTLSPGATSPFWMHWEQVPTGTETSCPSAAGLILTPPDETTQLRLDNFRITACSGGELDVSPMTPVGTRAP